MPCRNSSNSKPRVYGKISPPPMTNRNPRSRKLAFLLIALVVLAGFQPGTAKAQDLEQLRKAAEQGDAETQYNLGYMYDKGEGVPENDREAVKWFRKAAEQGYALAQYGLALMYANDDGVGKDYVKAYAWANLAAVQGENRFIMVKEWLEKEEKSVEFKDWLKKKMTTKQVAKAQKLSAELFKRIESSKP